MDKENWVRIISSGFSLPVLGRYQIPLGFGLVVAEDSHGNKKFRGDVYCADGKVIKGGVSSFIPAIEHEVLHVAADAVQAGLAKVDATDESKVHLGTLPSPLQQRCDEGEKSVVSRIGEWLSR